MQSFVRFQRATIFLTIGIVMLVLTGWILDISAFKSVLPGLESMKVNTALLFLLLSASFHFLQRNLKIPTIISSSIILFVSVATLLEDVLAIDLGIDQIILADRESLHAPGRMAPVTAVCFIFLSTALLMLVELKTKKLSQWLTHCVTLLSFIAIVGYVLNVPSFYKVAAFTSVALHTALLFFLVSIALSLVNPTLGLTGMLTGTGVGNKTARMLLPRMLVITLILSLATIWIYRNNVATVDFGIALYAVSFIVSVFFLMSYTSKILNESDEQRTQAEQSLNILNRELESEIVKRTEQVKKSERLLRSIIDNSKSAIFVKDLTGKYVLANKEFSHEFGLEPEELYSKTAFDIFPADIARKLVEDEDQIVNYRQFKIFEVPLTIKGKFRIMLTNKFPLLDETKAPYAICGILTEVTTLRMAEANLKAIFNSAPVSIIETESNGVIKNFNRGAEKLLGYSADEMVGKQTPVIIHDQKEIEERGKELSAQFGKSVQGFDVFVELPRRGLYEAREWTYVRKDKSTFPVQLVVSAVIDNFGHVTGFLGIATDVSEIKSVQRKLEKTQQLNTSIINTSYDGIVMREKSGEVILSNEAAERILGLTKDQLLGKKTVERDWKSIREDGSDFPAHEYPATVALQTGVPVRNRIMGVHKPDGTLTWILINSDPLLDIEKKPYAVVTSFTEITELKKKQDELNMSLEILTEQNKRLLNFAHIVSHNLKSHSNNIEGLLHFYKIAPNEKEKGESIDHLLSASASLKETVSNLTEIVDVQNKLSSKTININIRESLDKALDVISTDIKQNNAEIKIDIPADLSVEYNPSYLESIFLNFLTNAIKYRHPDRRPELMISCKRENGQVVLEFSDNGTGIDLDKFGHKLFGMYSTFHGNKDAKGIGLFLTKNQVEAMGGKIEVSSTVGKGTKFRVIMKSRLPSYEKV